MSQNDLALSHSATAATALDSTAAAAFHPAATAEALTSASADVPAEMPTKTTCCDCFCHERDASTVSPSLCDPFPNWPSNAVRGGASSVTTPLPWRSPTPTYAASATYYDVAANYGGSPPDATNPLLAPFYSALNYSGGSYDAAASYQNAIESHC